jgi:cytochrome c peroxidase
MKARHSLSAMLLEEADMSDPEDSSPRSPLQTIFKLSTSAVALLCCLGVSPPDASAQSPNDDTANRAWQQLAIKHANEMRRFPDADRAMQPTPPIISKFETDFDASGLIATDQPGGPTTTADNAFFQNLGTNGRTCFTCHQPQNGWTVSAQAVQARFYLSFGADPIFRLVDGATCPSDDVSSLAAKRNAYRLLLSKGLFRVGLPVPTGAQFQIVVVDDPYGCNSNPVTGLTSPSAGIVSVYRRPLPATNLPFLSTIMWDGREPSLLSQADDATLGHVQANAPLTPAQQQQIVTFETDLFTAQITAQIFDDAAKELSDAGAAGGPLAVAQQLPEFFIGINDPLGQNPTGAAFTPDIFDIYCAWAGLSGHDM